MEVYHIRHAHRIGKNPHISKNGLKKANKIGKKLPEFDKVLSSVSIRAVETAIALGFSIDETINFDDAEPKGSHSPSTERVFDTFEDFKRNIQNISYFKIYSSNLVSLLSTKLHSNKDLNKILIISHGGVIEYSTIGFLPNVDYKSWGPVVDHCNGVKLIFEDGDCIDGSKLTF